MSKNIDSCPCGSGKSYLQCCGSYIEAEQLPERPEQLMRSRYTAFVLGNTAYLLDTWHHTTRPEQLQLEDGVTWFGLEIVNCQGANKDEGWVEFIAKFNGNDRLQSLHERSRFLREDSRWWYVDGEIFNSATTEKIGRNAPCPCGSGKKFKRCCG